MGKVNPKVSIINYYDHLINQIDLYTEKLLEKIDDDALLREPEAYQLGIADCIGDIEAKIMEKLNLNYKRNYDQNDFEMHQVTIDAVAGQTKIRDYVNMVRERAISEVRLVQEQSLREYKKTVISPDYAESDEESTLREKIFANKFCFSLVIDQSPDVKARYFSRPLENKSIFKMYICLVDFYMSSEDIKLLKYSFKKKILKFNKNTIFDI